MSTFAGRSRPSVTCLVFAAAGAEASSVMRAVAPTSAQSPRFWSFLIPAVWTATSAMGKPRGATRLEAWASLDGDDVGLPDVGVGREQVRADLAERGRDLALEVRLPAFLVLERVEDAVRWLADPERVPGDGAGLLGREGPPLLQERGERLALAGLGLKQREKSSVDGHGGPFRRLAWTGATRRPPHRM